MVPHIPEKQNKPLMIEEMICRVIKNIIRSRYQQLMEENSVVYQEPFRRIACQIFEQTLHKNTELWALIKENMKKAFQFDLTDELINECCLCKIILVSGFY
jgi:hypothetical protein